MRARSFAPFVALVVAGCVASKGDVALLQNDLRAMRDASAQAASAERAHIDQVLAQITRTNDSVRMLSARLAKLQGDVQNDHYEMNRQILQIQELSGQSQRRLQELRASLEERNQMAAAPVPVAPSSGPVDTAASRPAPAGPGPAQLFQSSLDQLRRGSSTVAR